MADDLDNLISEVSGGTVTPDTTIENDGTHHEENAGAVQPQPQAKPASQPSDKHANRTEFFPEAEYENEEDPNFDISQVKLSDRKVWPKKYLNALAYRDQQLTKLQSELAAAKAGTAQPAAQPQGGNNAAPEGQTNSSTAPKDGEYTATEQAKIDAIAKTKPELNSYKGTYEEYQSALMDWKIEMRDAQKEIAQDRQKQSEAQEAQIEANTNRIINQSKALIEKRPELLNVVAANAPILDSYPPHVLNAFGSAEHPELAFLALASEPGALQRLGLMDERQALMFVATAQAIGKSMVGAQANAEEDGAEEQPSLQTQPSKPVSGAPTPMRAARGAASGAVQLADKPIEDILKEIGVE